MISSEVQGHQAQILATDYLRVLMADTAVAAGCRLFDAQKKLKSASTFVGPVSLDPIPVSFEVRFAVVTRQPSGPAAASPQNAKSLVPSGRRCVKPS
ncbi:Uncharacterised protein [Mycobacteroides abscessus subsp. abscessus]|nr:Uncharacterised protein [Mycobacteroides abscessus subsp. abscessus]SKR36560.1 Uncharacterised protein [Mycobacteroides abscessus subsp. abscessus]